MSASPFWTRERLQHALAGATGLGGVIAMLVTVNADTGAILLPLVGAAAAAIAIQLRALGAQLLARAAWWSNLGLGTILSVLGGGSEREVGLALSITSALALVIAGRQSLAAALERAEYAPAAFRGSLLALMVLALADAQTLGLLGWIEIDDHHEAGWVLAAGAAAFVFGFVWLYRLSIWGAVINTLTAGAVFTLTAAGIVRLDEEVAPVVLVVCGAQVLVALPLLLSVLRGTPPRFRPSAGVRAAVAYVSIGALVALSALGVFVFHR